MPVLQRNTQSYGEKSGPAGRNLVSRGYIVVAEVVSRRRRHQFGGPCGKRGSAAVGPLCRHDQPEGILAMRAWSVLLAGGDHDRGIHVQHGQGVPAAWLAGTSPGS